MTQIKEFAHSIITSLEEHVQKDYGERPQIVLGDIEDYLDILKELNQKTGKALTEKQLKQHAFFQCLLSDGVYFHEIHKIFVYKSYYKKIFSDPKKQYILGHELVHGYQRNLNYEPAKVLETANSEKQKIIFKFIEKAISEGHADFLAVEMFLANKTKFPYAARLAKETHNKRLLYFYEGIWTYDYSRVRNIEERLDKRHTTGLMNALQPAYAYPVGYNYILKQHFDGKDVDECLFNQPKTIKELMKGSIDLTTLELH